MSGPLRQEPPTATRTHTIIVSEQNLRCSGAHADTMGWAPCRCSAQQAGSVERHRAPISSRYDDGKASARSQRMGRRREGACWASGLCESLGVAQSRSWNPRECCACALLFGRSPSSHRFCSGLGWVRERSETGAGLHRGEAGARRMWITGHPEPRHQGTQGAECLGELENGGRSLAPRAATLIADGLAVAARVRRRSSGRGSIGYARHVSGVECAAWPGGARHHRPPRRGEGGHGPQLPRPVDAEDVRQAADSPAVDAFRRRPLRGMQPQRRIEASRRQEHV